MAYENLGEGALDYLPCRYGNSKLMFRGPKRKLTSPYVVALGGTETYGKFVAEPFPALTERRLDMNVVNLGCVNAGVDVFTDDRTVLDVCSDAAATILQIPGAQNVSNRFYAVHPRRNDRFLRASNLLKTIFREVDFTEFNFTRHLLTTLAEVSADKFAMVEEELKEAWVARMKTLISRVSSPVVLLWMSDRAPGEGPTGVNGNDPLFVDEAMIAQLTPFVGGYAEVIVNQDEIATGREGLRFNPLEEPAAQEMLGLVAHERTADALAEVLAGIV